MLTIIISAMLVLTMSSAFVWFLCLRAPEGYEDKSGFHYVAEPEPAIKMTSQSRTVARKSHNDHEPLAA